MQAAQRGALCWPRGVWWSGRWEGGSRGRGHMYTYGLFMLMYGRNHHSRSSNYPLIKKKKKRPGWSPSLPSSWGSGQWGGRPAASCWPPPPPSAGGAITPLSGNGPSEEIWICSAHPGRAPLVEAADGNPARQKAPSWPTNESSTFGINHVLRGGRESHRGLVLPSQMLVASVSGNRLFILPAWPAALRTNSLVEVKPT